MINSFQTPTEIFFGEGAIQKVSDIIKKENFKKVLIMTDKGLIQAGILKNLTNILDGNCNYMIFDEVEPNPTDIIVKNGYAIFQKESPDCFIALGGGSSMDTAKAIGILATNGGEIKDYKGLDQVKKPITPIISIPTTAGTGSEVTTTTVINDTNDIVKYSVLGKHVASRWAILDPELTLTLPSQITAATGIDALTHAIEAYTSKVSYPLTDTLAVEAIRLIGENLRTAVHNGNDIQSRNNMLEASLIAGIAFNNAKLGLCHVLCNPLGAHFGVAHGVANSILLPRVTKFNVPSEINKYAHIAELLGENIESYSTREAANKAIHAIEQLIKDVNIPFTLDELDVDKNYINKMVDECIENPLIKINPREAKKEDLVQIYKECFK